MPNQQLLREENIIENILKSKINPFTEANCS